MRYKRMFLQQAMTLQHPQFHQLKMLKFQLRLPTEWQLKIGKRVSAQGGSYLGMSSQDLFQEHSLQHLYGLQWQAQYSKY